MLNKHYCRNELKAMALFVKAKSCHSTMQEKRHSPACPMHEQMACRKSSGQHKKGCCDDQTEYLKNMQDQQFQPMELPVLKIPAPRTVLISSYQQDAASSASRCIPYLNYKPPLLACDRPVVFQAFLL
ncbi:MAG TPA: hypothetical protein PLU64_00250 [Saprospiraceae bacterium]|nr:hypothetical protein [Saprospiraceae bacterium]